MAFQLEHFRIWRWSQKRSAAFPRNSAVAIETEKSEIFFRLKAMPRCSGYLHNLYLTLFVKCIKFSSPGFSNAWAWTSIQTGLENRKVSKWLPTSNGSLKKAQREIPKIIYFCLLTIVMTVWIRSLMKFWKIRDIRPPDLHSWKYMQVREASGLDVEITN